MGKIERFNEGWERAKRNNKNSSLAISSGNSKIDRFNKGWMQGKIGLNTLTQDLENTNKLINSVYVDRNWQNPESMKTTQDSIQKMYQRLKDYKTYQNQYGNLDDAMAFNQEMNGLLSQYNDVIKQGDGLAELYAQYQNEDAYNKMRTRTKLKEQYPGLSYKEAQKMMSQYAENSDEYNFFKEYGINAGYDDLREYDAELAELDEEPEETFIDKVINTVDSMQNAVGIDIFESKNDNPSYRKRLQEARNQYALDHSFDLYKDYMDKEDFEENSKYVSTMKDGQIGDETYEYINNPNIRGQIIRNHNVVSGESFIYNAPIDAVKMHLDMMNEDEKAVYNYIRKTEGGEAAYEYLKNIETMLGKRAADKDSADMEELVDDSTAAAVGMSVISPLMMLGGNIGTQLETIDSKLSGEKYDPYSVHNTLSNVTSALRGHVGDNIEENTDLSIAGINVPSFLYDTGMSMADSALNAAAFKRFGSVVMGASAYQQKAKELTEAGADEKTIYTGAMMAGTAETVFEFISLDKLISIESPKTIKELFSNAVKQSFVEGSEEFCTEVTNILTDAWLRQDTSEIQKEYEYYIARGYTEAEAWKMVGTSTAKNVATAYVGGAISGGIMGGGYSSVQHRQLANIGHSLKETMDIEGIMGVASSLEKSSEAYKEYERLNKKGITDAKLNNAQVGNLYSRIMETENGPKMIKELAISNALKRKQLEAKGNQGTERQAKDYQIGQKSELRGTGKAIQIQDIQEKDGKVVFETNEGSVEADNVTLTLQDASMVSEAENMDEGKRKTYIQQYYTGDVKDVELYTAAFNLVYAYGQSGFGSNSVLNDATIRNSLSLKQIGAIYEAGVIDKVRMAERALEQNTKKYSKNTVSKGTFDDSIIDYENKTTDGSRINAKNLSKKQKDAIAFIRGFSKVTGVNVTFFASKANENGVRTAENGRYDSDTNTIYVDVYAGINQGVLDDSIIPTLSHELTHWMKDKAPKAYSELREVVMNGLTKQRGIKAENLVYAEMERIEKAHKDLEVTEEYAIDELMARACEDMISNSTVAKKLLGRLSQEHKKTIFDKVCDLLDNLAGWIDSLLQKYSSRSIEAKILRENKSLVDEVQKKWDKALWNAIQNNVTVKNEKQFSDRVKDNSSYHIEQDGTVIIDNLKYYGNSEITNYKKDIKKILREGLMELRGKKVKIESDGREVVFDKKTANEYTGSKYTYNSNLNIQKVKADIASCILQIVKTAKNPRWMSNQEQKHRKDAARGWTYYDVRFGLNLGKGIVYFTGKLDIRMDGNDIDYVYDIVRILKEQNTHHSTADSNTGDIRSALQNSVTPSSQNINTQFSDRVKDNSLYHIEQDGTVIIDNLKYYGNSEVRDYKNDIKSLLRDSLKKLEGKKVIIQSDGREVTFDKKTVTEYSGSKDTYSYQLEKKKVKADAATGILEIVKKAKRPRWVKNKEIKHKKSAGRGWTYYDVKFGINLKEKNIIEYFTGVLNVRMADDNIDYVYDITKIQKEQTTHYGNTKGNTSDQQSALQNSVTPSSQNINTQFSDRNAGDYGLSPQEYALYEQKVWEKHRKYKSFPKTRDGNTIFTIGNKLVYNKGNAYNNKITKVVSIIVEEDSENENTYTSFAQEDIIEYETNRKYEGTSFGDFAQIESDHYIYDFGKKIIISTDYESHSVTAGRDGLGKQEQVRRKLTEYFGDQQDGERDDSEGKSGTGDNSAVDVTPDNLYYSDRMASIYDVVEQAEKLQKENDILKQDINNLNEIRKWQRKLSQTSDIKASMVGVIADKVLADYGSSYDKKVLEKQLMEFYENLTRSEHLQWDSIMQYACEIATDVKTGIEDSNNYAQEVLEELKKARIKLTEEQKERVSKQYGSRYQDAFLGKVQLDAESGSSLELLWKQWSTKYPDVFDGTISRSLQADELLKVYDQMKLADNTYKYYDDAQFVRKMAVDIYNCYWNMDNMQVAKGLYENEIKRLKAEHRKNIQTIRDGYELKMALKNDAMMKIIKKVKEDKYEYVKKRITGYRENVEKKAEIDKITKKILRLNKLLLKNSSTDHIPEVMKPAIIALINSIDFSSKQKLGLYGDKYQPTQRDLRLDVALSEVHEMIGATEIVDEKSDIACVFYPPGYEKEVRELCKKVNEIYEQNNVKDGYVLNYLSLEQLIKLKDMITVISRIVSTLNQSLSTRNAHKMDSLAMETIEYLKEQGDENKIAEGAKNFIQYNNTLPYFFFKRFGKSGEIVFQALQDGWDKFAFHIKEIMNYAESVYTSEEIKEWSKQYEEITYINPKLTDEGMKETTFKISIPQIMSLYCLMKREQARKHILKGGGVQIADSGKGIKIVSKVYNHVLSEEIINEITGRLTDRQRFVADKLQEFMNTVCRDWGNEISMRRFGIRSFDEDNYFPIKSNPHDIKKQGHSPDAVSLFRLLNMSFTKATDIKANNSIVIEDIFDVFANHTSDMAKYNALALPVLDTYNWINFKEKRPLGNEESSEENGQHDSVTLSGVVEAVYGEGAENYIVRLLRDINGESDSGRGDAGFKKLISNYKIAAVGANLRVALLQPTAYVRASAVINPKYLAHMPKNIKECIKKAEKYSGIALWKSLGFYDTNIARGFKKMIKHDDEWYDVVKDKSMIAAELGDKMTWGLIWNACEEEIKDTKPLRVGSDDYYKVVADRFREVIYSTQVVDSTMTRTEMMRSKNTFAQMLTSFMSEPMVSYNMLMDCYFDWSRDARIKGSYAKTVHLHGRKFARVFSAYTATNFAAALAGGIMDVLREDESDEPLSVQMLQTVMENFLSDMTLIGKLPYVKDLISITKGYNPSRMDEQAFVTLWSAGKKWEKVFGGDSKNVYSAVYKSTQGVSQLSGLPVSNVMRDAVAIWNKTVGEVYPSLIIK